jgi:hypothetical protein
LVYVSCGLTFIALKINLHQPECHVGYRGQIGSAGGETSLENLMLLCTRHHRLVQEGGFRIEKDYQDRWFFKRPDGHAVPRCGYRPEDMTDDYVDEDDCQNDFANPSAEGLLASRPQLHPPVHKEQQVRMARIKGHGQEA